MKLNLHTFIFLNIPSVLHTFFFIFLKSQLKINLTRFELCALLYTLFLSRVVFFPAKKKEIFLFFNKRRIVLEEQLAQVIASQAVTNTFFAETYYFLSIPLMMLIHVGFLSYEMGATRVKNVLSSGIKNLLAFSFTIVAWYLFGWWFYWALTNRVYGVGRLYGYIWYRVC